MRLHDLAAGGELRAGRRFAGGERVGDAGRMRAVGLDGVGVERHVVGVARVRLGNGTVTVTSAATAATTPQTLTATIAGQTFTATVAGVACTYTFLANAPDQNGNTWLAPWDGSQRGVTVGPNDGSCAAWKASSDADWIVVSPASAAKSTTVRVDYDRGSRRHDRDGLRDLRADRRCGESVLRETASSLFGERPTKLSASARKCAPRPIAGLLADAPIRGSMSPKCR